MNASDQVRLAGKVVTTSPKTPVVILGANGTGKTTHGVDLATAGAVRISTRRILNVGENIATRPVEVAEREFQQSTTNLGRNRLEFHSDLELALQTIISGDVEHARQVRALLRKSPNEVAKAAASLSMLDRTLAIWHSLFPKRTLTFDRDKPLVTATHGTSTTPYAARLMSDGELQALYLISKIQLAPKDSVLVIDEPEISLHLSLARSLWDAIEASRTDCRFIYITHDLDFAITRRNAVFALCRAPGEVEVASSIPEDMRRDILGGASATLRGRTLLYCEGEVESIDARFLEAWLCKQPITVHPVGSCDRVVNCVDFFVHDKSIGLEAKGVVDRDSRSDAEITTLTSLGIHVLSTAQIEHLFCIPGVVVAVAKHLGKADAEAHERILSTIAERLRARASQALYRHAHARSVDHARWNLRFLVDRVSPGANAAEAQANLKDGLAKGLASLDPESEFKRSMALLEDGVKGNWDSFFKVVPDKSSLHEAAAVLGISPDNLVTIVCEGLHGRVGTPEFHKALETALQPYLPPRNPA